MQILYCRIYCQDFQDGLLDPIVLEIFQDKDRIARGYNQTDPQYYDQKLKSFVSKLDLSKPKERASQIAFMLNSNIHKAFKEACQNNIITEREGLHVAIQIFCEFFGKKKQ